MTRASPFADLKGTLETFVKRLYGEDSVVRFRPHHFPFTEPSAEVDVQCFPAAMVKAAACAKAKVGLKFWAAGMVHPKVSKQSAELTRKYTAALRSGMGLERVVMRRL